MTWRAMLPAIAVAVAVGATRVDAKLCGDDVGGQDVACACGDVIVSDVVLDASDPVTQERCAADGLVVRAPQASHGLTVDLRGQSLRGSGHGAGILLLDGGPGGASVVSTGGTTATIEGFQDGVLAHGDTAVAAVSDLLVLQSRRDGVRLDAPGFDVHDVVVQNAGRDGFGLVGKGYHVARTRAEGSHRYGYAVWGSDGTVGVDGDTVVALGSGMTGFNVMGMGHTLIGCVATGGMKDGITLWGMHFVVRSSDTSSNGGNGMAGMGMDWRMAGNRADDNGNNGIDLGGYWMVDEGGNHGAGNQGLGERTPVVQCEIDGQPCKP